MVKCVCGKNESVPSMYKIETWRYNNILKTMELIYALCHHNKIIVNKEKINAAN
jgi:hypothetical protein